MRAVRRMIDLTMLCRGLLERIGYQALLAALIVFAVPDTGFARVFDVFGPENFARSGGGPGTEVRQFQVQRPNDAEFNLHVFYGGLKKDFEGIVPSALVTLNGQPVVTPDDFNRNNHYIKKPVTLAEANTLSVALRGKPGSGVRVVITGKNDEPQVFDFKKTVQPDGIELFGLDLNYAWIVVDKPEGGNATLSAPNSPSTSLRVDRPGEYILLLKIGGATWEESFPVKLVAEYPKFVPVPVETRIDFGVGAGGFYAPDYGISVGPNTYLRPAAVSCGSPTNTGFQVLVLDRTDLSRKDHKTFNTPCANQDMINYLASLSNTTTYPVAPLVIVSSLNMTKASDVCGNSSTCPLGHSLEALGGTTLYSSNYNNTNWINYSLIGIPGLGASNGSELNSWDHRAFYYPDPKINADMLGYFVQDVNGKWTFTYPDFVQIETRPQPQTNPPSNVIMVGTTPYNSEPLKPGAVGGFQVLVLDRDNLGLPNYPLTISPTATFSTNASGTLGDQEQQAMYDYLNTVKLTQDRQRFVVVIASVGVPITYKSTVFPNLIKLIGDYYGGTTGILNELGAVEPSIVTYSLVGMTKPDFSTYSLGAVDSVEASALNQSLKVVMHKDKQGWYGPITTYTGVAGASSPDFSLVSVAFQPSTYWPLPNMWDPSYQEQVYAYQYISNSLGINANGDIRSFYTIENLILPNYNSCLLMAYPSPDPNPYFSPDVFAAMKSQLCTEFNYVNYVNGFKADLHDLLADMQVSSGNELDVVYNDIKSTVSVDNTDKIGWDILLAIRGMLMVGTALAPVPGMKATLGAMNAAMFLAMHFSKGPSGADYTSVDTQYQNLQTQMNNLWNNCQTGKDLLLDMIKSDWGKLLYVGNKLTTVQSSGGWMYDATDTAAWKAIVTDTFEAYYFQSLLPAVWKIDYVNSRSIPAPKNFRYTAQTGYCAPYCSGSTANPTAYWVDSFLDGGHSWYVLENGITQSTYCGYVKFGSSADLRKVLFGSGDWTDSSGNKIGVNLNLSLPFFYERWLPSSAYQPPTMPLYGEVSGYNGTCSD